jgi:hypothetical protein
VPLLGQRKNATALYHLLRHGPALFPDRQEANKLTEVYQVIHNGPFLNVILSNQYKDALAIEIDSEGAVGDNDVAEQAPSKRQRLE